MSIDRWMDKEAVVHIYTMEYYSVIKRNTFESVLMRWTNLEPIIQSEISQKQENKYCLLMHIYESRKMILMNLFSGKEWRCFPCNSVARICLQFKRTRFDPWVRKVPWRRE